MVLGLAVLLWAARFSGSAQAYELTATEQRSFPFRAGQRLRLSLAHGELRVHFARGKALAVHVKKWVEASTQSRAQEKLEQLTLDFSPSEEGLEIRQLDRSVRNPLSNLLRSAGFSRKIDTRVMMDVYLPAPAEMEVRQKSGLVRMDSLSVNADILLDSGRLVLRNLVADRIALQLGQVDARLVSIRSSEEGTGQLTAEIKDGRLVIRDCVLYRATIRSEDADVFLLGSRFEQCEATSKTGDFFLRPILQQKSRLYCESKAGDFFVKLPPNPETGLLMATGAGRIECPYTWEIRRSGGSEDVRTSPAGDEPPRVQLFSELGDFFVQPVIPRRRGGRAR